MKSPVVLSLAALAACEGAFVPPAPYPPPPPAVASIRVTPDSGTVIAGDTLALTALLRDSTGDTLTGRQVLWYTPDSLVAAIDQFGVVTGLRAGEARVRATAGPVADTVLVIVTPLVFNQITTGGGHTCAAGNNAYAYCWGDNSSGQLGIGTGSLQQPVSVVVSQSFGFAAVSAGAAHTCALTRSGAASCWGRNDEGELGRGATPGNPALPAPVLTAVRFLLIAAGGLHSCAVGTDGFTYCWGFNTNGEVGDGTSQPRSTPTRIVDDPGFNRLAAGATHSCALTTAGTAFCWGANANGQLGDGTRADRHSATAVVGAGTFTAIAAGGAHSCAVSGSAMAYCWGLNTRQQLGAGLPDSFALTPVPVSGGLSLRVVATGGVHSCALTTDSLAMCWGGNDHGQLGDSSTIDRPTPVPVYGGLKFADLRAGAQHTCGMTAAFVVYCWGDGSKGQLGRSFVGSSTIPVRVAGQ